MSSLGNLVADIGAAAGDEGESTIQSLVKNPQLQKRLDDALGDYDKTKSSSSMALDQFIKDYLAGNKTASTRSTQEQGELDRYYNGDVERDLASLRQRRAGAGDQALSRALAYMTRGRNMDRVGGFGGDSSYDRQLALKQGSDLSLQTLMENLSQERADQDYLRQMQLGLAGKRTGMADALAARGLVPSQMQKQELGWSMGSLNDFLRMDNLNKIYGVKYEPSAWETAGAITGDVASLAASIYSGGATDMMGGMMGGGGGGGGGKLSSMSKPTWSMSSGGMDQWGGPVNANAAYASSYNYPANYDYEAAPAGYEGWGFPSAAPGGGAGVGADAGWGMDGWSLGY